MITQAEKEEIIKEVCECLSEYLTPRLRCRNCNNCECPHFLNVVQKDREVDEIEDAIAEDEDLEDEITVW